MLAQIEKVSLRPDESFACRRFRANRFTSPFHFHPECELTWIEASHGLRFAGDSIRRFDAGDVVLLGANLPHYWNNPPDWQGEARSVVVQFTEDLPYFRAPELEAVRRLLQRARRGVHFAGQAARVAAARMERMVDLAPMPRLLLLLETLHGLAKTTGGRLLASAGYAPVFNSADQVRLARVLDYVDRTAAEGARQQEAARLAGLSPAAFSRYFQRKLGRSFVAFVNEVRVGRVCRALIEQPERSVAEIAYAAGFNNLANFNRQFKQRMDLAPLAYRRAHRAAYPVQAEAPLGAY